MSTCMVRDRAHLTIVIVPFDESISYSIFLHYLKIAQKRHFSPKFCCWSRRWLQFFKHFHKNRVSQKKRDFPGKTEKRLYLKIRFAEKLVYARKNSDYLRHRQFKLGENNLLIRLETETFYINNGAKQSEIELSTRGGSSLVSQCKDRFTP